MGCRPRKSGEGHAWVRHVLSCFDSGTLRYRHSQPTAARERTDPRATGEGNRGKGLRGFYAGRHRGTRRAQSATAADGTQFCFGIGKLPACHAGLCTALQVAGYSIDGGAGSTALTYTVSRASDSGLGALSNRRTLHPHLSAPIRPAWRSSTCRTLSAPERQRV